MTDSDSRLEPLPNLDVAENLRLQRAWSEYLAKEAERSARVQKKIEALHARYLDERRELLGSATTERLAALRRRLPDELLDPASESEGHRVEERIAAVYDNIRQRRQRLLQEAAVDVSRLRRVDEAHQDSVLSILSHSPESTEADTPGTDEVVFEPPYPTTARRLWGWTSRGRRIVAPQLDRHSGLVGGQSVIEIRDAGDAEVAHQWIETGFVVERTMPRAGQVRVRVRLRPPIQQHRRITPYNELGLSSMRVIQHVSLYARHLTPFIDAPSYYPFLRGYPMHRTSGDPLWWDGPPDNLISPELSLLLPGHREAGERIIVEVGVHLWNHVVVNDYSIGARFYQKHALRSIGLSVLA